VPADARAIVYERLGDLPHFNPDNDAERPPEAVADMRRLLASAAAVMFCCLTRRPDRGSSDSNRHRRRDAKIRRVAPLIPNS
jgi:hypothetical protein